MPASLFEIRDDLAELRREKEQLLKRLVDLLLDDERLVKDQTSAAMALQEQP